MFPPWALIFEALSTFFMRLGTCILDAEVHTSFACLLGSSWFSIVYKCITYLKEQIPLAPFTIGKDAQIMSLSRNLVQCLDRLFNPTATLIRKGFVASRYTGAYNSALSCRWRSKHHDSTGANLVNVLKCRCRVKESSILLATISLPNESTGSVHEQYGPPA